MHQHSLLMKKITFLFILSALFFSSCEESGSSTEKMNPEETSSTDDIVVENFSKMDSRRALLAEKLIRSIPSLSESAQIYNELNESYSMDLLNPMENAQRYTTLKEKGLNLGVYLGDLSYISIFEQTQEAIFYMNSSKKIAESIGVTAVFDEATMERMESNLGNQDSIIHLISQLYWKTDNFLKQSNRQNISALIITGGWIEGMRLGADLIQNHPETTHLYASMLQQEVNLDRIIRLLETFEGDEVVEPIMAECQRLMDIYKSLPEAQYDENKTRQVTEIEKEKINQLCVEIINIRNEWIQA